MTVVDLSRSIILLSTLSIAETHLVYTTFQKMELSQCSGYFLVFMLTDGL
jgi:hypothetical protein